MSNKLLSGKVVGDELVIDLCPKIETKNAAQVEEEIFEILNANPGKDVTLDADNLVYISSVGLRILMKVKKRYPSMKMVNASNEVYEILEMTGVDSIIPISKKLRELSVDGLKVIGSGFNGKVYRLDDETIVKVIENPNMTYEMIQNERDTAQKVFLMGVPSAISFDVVRVGDQYGIVYELVDSDSLLNQMHENKDQLFELGKQFGEFMRQVHEMDIDSTGLADSITVLEDRVGSIKDRVTEEEYNLYSGLIDSIPEGKSFIHGDFHPGNILVQNGEMVLIDMGDSGVGNPMIDLIAFGSFCIGTNLFTPDGQVSITTQMTKEENNEAWRGFLHGYFGTDDQEYLDEVESQLLPRIYLKTLTGIIVRVPNLDLITDPEERKREEAANQYSLKVIDLMKNLIAEKAGNMKGSISF